MESGRQIGETGAHVRGHNQYSIGICLVGGITKDKKNHGEYTAKQWQALHRLLRELEANYPHACICGHRDLSPDLNGDGKITSNEWLKACPCFDVQLADQAMRKCGIVPKHKAIRGGIDGAKLAEMGIACPNLFTGGYNFHSKHELITLEGMMQAVEVIVTIIQSAVEKV